MGREIKIKETLEFLLDDCNMTSRELEKESGVVCGTVYRITSGRGMPSLQSVIALADYFCCSVDYLLFGEE